MQAAIWALPNNDNNNNNKRESYCKGHCEYYLIFVIITARGPSTLHPMLLISRIFIVSTPNLVDQPKIQT